MAEYFILCQRPGCENIKRVVGPYEQKRRKFCSHRCANLAHNELTHEAKVRGGLARGRQRQQEVLAKVKGLDSVASFRLGYTTAMQKWHRAVRARHLEARG